MSACRMCYPLLAAPLAVGVNEVEHEVGDVARTTMPATQVTAMNPSLHETGCA